MRGMREFADKFLKGSGKLLDRINIIRKIRNQPINVQLIKGIEMYLRYFSKTFQQAGARSVMVSLWNIPLDESMQFYKIFYKALKEGKSKTESLKAARQAVRNKEPHPYFWSGLILHGEG